MTFTNTFKRKACRVIAALAAVACTMSLAACGADETGKIRIGIKFDQPGLGFKKSGTYVGFDVDVPNTSPRNSAIPKTRSSGRKPPPSSVRP